MLIDKLRSWIIYPSTRSFIQEARRTSKYSLFDWLHGYVYLRWPYFYIGIATGKHPLAKAFGPVFQFLTALLSPSAADPSVDKASGFSMRIANGYHGKVVPLEEATKLVTVDQDVCLTDLEKVIPYASARDIILKNPNHIVALDCPCRAGHPHPCEPVRVCIVIGEPFAALVSDHHPHRSQKVTATEAIEILRGERDRGHVHHAFFKDAMLNRFYTICNCCACCCAAINAHKSGTPMLAPSGYVSRVESDRCSGCDLCTEFCQFGAVVMMDGVAVIDESLCMGCGICVAHCPPEAISLIRAPEKGEPLEIHELIAQAADRQSEWM